MWEQKTEDKPKCVTSCGNHNETDDLILIDYYVKSKIDYLMKKYTNLEWLAYLIGQDNIVDDLYIPKQKVTATSVDNIEGDPERQIIGVIHSHHNLGLHSFSGVDHSYINDNHSLSILVWNTGMNGQKKITLPCGSHMIVPIKIEFFYADLNEEDFEKEANDNISRKIYEVPVGKYGPYVPTDAHRYYLPNTWQGPEKKTGKEPGNGDARTARGSHSKDYEAYLDHLVYDEGFEGMEICAEDLPPTDEEVEAHFQRIEDRELGLPLLPRAPKKTGCGPWEV